MSVSFSGDGKYVVSGSADKSIKIWNIQEKREDFTLSSTNLSSGRFAEEGKCFLNGSEKDDVNSLNVKERRLKHNIKGLIGYGGMLKLSLDSKYIISEPRPYYSQILNDFLEFQTSSKVKILIDEEFFNSLNTLSPQHITDPYIQSLLPFKFTLNCILGDNLPLIPSSSLDFYFSTGIYRPTHIAAFKGNKVALKMWLQPGTQIILRGDAYSKSPLFYSIMNKHQECTQILMEYIISLKSTEKILIS